MFYRLALSLDVNTIVHLSVSAGAFWTSILRSYVRYRSPTLTCMPVSYVESTFKVGQYLDFIKVLKPCCIGPSIMANFSLSLPGRGLKSHAYTHSVQFTHHVFLNLHTLKFYCLPDNYEIIDSSLEDVTVGERTVVRDGPIKLSTLQLPCVVTLLDLLICEYWHLFVRSMC